VTIEKPWTSQSKTCQEWEEAQVEAGKMVVEMDGTDKYPGVMQARLASAKLMSTPCVAALLKGARTQVHVVGGWHDKISACVVPVQCLIDVEPAGDYAYSLADIKTDRNAHPAAFEQTIRSRGYHIQAAWNLDMFNAATGQKRDVFYLPVSENVAPWQCETYFLDEAEMGDNAPRWIDRGRVLYQQMMARYAHCLVTGHWPGHTSGWTAINPAKPFLDDAIEQNAIELAPAPLPLPKDPSEQRDDDFTP
jgi:hypothetical protein